MPCSQQVGEATEPVEFQARKVLRDRFGRSHQARPLVPRGPHYTGRVGRVPANREFVRFDDFQPQRRQHIGGEVRLVERDQESRSAVDSRRQDVAVIRVRERVQGQEVFVARNRCAGQSGLHQGERPPQGRCLQVGAVRQKVAHPLRMDRVAPPGAVHIGKREPDEPIAQRRRVENIGVEESDRWAIHLIPQVEFLGLGLEFCHRGLGDRRLLGLVGQHIRQPHAPVRVDFARRKNSVIK